MELDYISSLIRVPGLRYLAKSWQCDTYRTLFDVPLYLFKNLLEAVNETWIMIRKMPRLCKGKACTGTSC